MERERLRHGRGAKACCTALVCACTAFAQQAEPRRDRALGLVQRADGTPWAGARVHLLHRTHPVDDRVADAVEAVADERGGWRADVLAGQVYSVWAHGPIEGGTYRCTRLVAEIQAGSPTVLVEEPEPRVVRRVRCTGTEAWRAPARR